MPSSPPYLLNPSEPRGAVPPARSPHGPWQSTAGRSSVSEVHQRSRQRPTEVGREPTWGSCDSEQNTPWSGPHALSSSRCRWFPLLLPRRQEIHSGEPRAPGAGRAAGAARASRGRSSLRMRAVLPGDAGARRGHATWGTMSGPGTSGCPRARRWWPRSTAWCGWPAVTAPRAAAIPRWRGTANYVVLEHAGGLETQYLHFTTVSVVSRSARAAGRPARLLRQDRLGLRCAPALQGGDAGVRRLEQSVGRGAASRVSAIPQLGAWLSSPPCGAPLRSPRSSLAGRRGWQRRLPRRSSGAAAACSALRPCERGPDARSGRPGDDPSSAERAQGSAATAGSERPARSSGRAPPLGRASARRDCCLPVSTTGQPARSGTGGECPARARCDGTAEAGKPSEPGRPAGHRGRATRRLRGQPSQREELTQRFGVDHRRPAGLAASRGPERACAHLGAQVSHSLRRRPG